MKMEPVKLTFFIRVVFQVPTLLTSALTMVFIARNLGPTGRGEISGSLLVVAMASQVITTPFFLTIMHLQHASEARRYISGSLYFFTKPNIAVITVANILLFTLSQDQDRISYQSLMLLNVLMFTYFISTQIRDYLLKLQWNHMYFLDFLIQILIVASILFLILNNSLTVFNTLAVFAIAYTIFTIVLLTILKLENSGFKLRSLIRRQSTADKKIVHNEFKEVFALSGFILYFALNKDILLAFLILSKSDLGLMSATSTFWTAIRFLRPSAILHTKIEESSDLDSVSNIRSTNESKPMKLSNLRRQSFLICLSGVSAYFLTPRLLGGGFQPTIVMTVFGLLAEVFLMRFIFEISMRPNKLKEKYFLSICLLQWMFLFSLNTFTNFFSISTIWASSVFSYILWLSIIKLLRVKKNV